MRGRSALALAAVQSAGHLGCLLDEALHDALWTTLLLVRAFAKQDEPINQSYPALSPSGLTLPFVPIHEIGVWTSEKHFKQEGFSS
jgi:hypothetical protein